MRRLWLSLLSGMCFFFLMGCWAKETTESRAEFRIVNGTEPESLDPHFISGVPEHRINVALFEGLTSVDPQSGKAIPGLAEGWTIDESKTVYTFFIREATWSDGVPITAQTVLQSWLRILAPETAAPYAWFPASMIKGAAAYHAGEAHAEQVGLHAPNERTFEVTLVSPMPYLLTSLTHDAFGVVPLHVIDKYKHSDTSWTDPDNFVGNGPFVLESWEPQSKITCVPNPLYWDKENVQLDRITYFPFYSSKTAYDMYLNGEVDWLTSAGISSESIPEALRHKHLQKIPRVSTSYYNFNVTKPPLDDVRVRKALVMSVDPTPMFERLLQGGEPPAHGMVPPLPGYTPIEGLSYDVDEAQKWLAEAGFPGGKGFPQLTVLYNTNERHQRIAEYIQSEWVDNLGVKVDLQHMAWKTFLSVCRKGDYEIARNGWVGDYSDPSAFLDMFVSSRALNTPRWNNSTYDVLIAKAARAKPGPARMGLLAQAERLLVEEEAVVMPLFHHVDIDLIDINKWGGWYPNAMQDHPLKTIYLKKKS